MKDKEAKIIMDEKVVENSNIRDIIESDKDYESTSDPIHEPENKKNNYVGLYISMAIVLMIAAIILAIVML